MADAKKFVVIIIGAGPAGLAAEVYINHRYEEWVKREGQKNTRQQLVTMIIEKSDVTAPLWRSGTYDNLTLQCRKSKCALPGLKFPKKCPKFPRRSDFIEYLDEYEKNLKNEPHYNTEVMKAVYLEDDKQWEIMTQKHTTGQPETKMYSCMYLVVASGLNAVPRIPYDLPGLADYFPPVDPANPLSPMKQIHSSKYKNGKIYSGKKVLVVGCGDSGIDICGDLHNEGATPYIVVNRRARNDVNSVNERTEKFYKDAPRVDGKINWPFETNLSDLSKAVGNRGQCELGNIDESCSIQVYACSDIVSFHENSVKLLDLDDPLEIDCVILATGYDHNVNKWLEGTNITFNDIGDLQFHDAVGNIIGAIDDKHPFKNRISAIGFDSKHGLHALKTDVVEVYDRVEKA